MSALPSLFEDFLSNIRPTNEQRENYIEGHKDLRDHLESDDTVDDFYVWDFLQGSYRRYTAVKPQENEKSDVDVVFVTNLDKNEYEPKDAMEKCKPVLEKHYNGQWSENDRSYKIERDKVEIDLVLTAAPSEAANAAIESLGSIEVGAALNADQSPKITDALGIKADETSDEWKDEPLDIPDRRLEEWDKTHPLATIDFTLRKNDSTNYHYVNVVKAIKWWRRTMTPDVDGPASYPLEHIIGQCCPNDIDSVAEGVTLTLETIDREFGSYAANYETPFLQAHGLPNTNVLKRIDGSEFATFYDEVVDAADIARAALNEDDKATARDRWHSLFGDEFPPYGGNDDNDEGERATTIGSSSGANVSNHQFG